MLDLREKRVMDEIAHFSLKHDLVQHFWENLGAATDMDVQLE